MSKNLFQDVRDFSLIGESPQFSKQPERTLQLCYDLVKEEVQDEFLPALMKYSENKSLENLAEAVDGAIDGIYVLIFFLNQMSLDGQKHWDLVQKSNMDKFPNGIALRGPNGKIKKPEGWQPPDHLPLLIEWNSEMRGEIYKGGFLQGGVESK